MKRLALSVLPPAAAAALLAGGCQKDPSVTLSVALPTDVAQAAEWMEIGVFPGSACPSANELAGGLPPTGSVARLVFHSGEASVPPLGELKKGAYAFAAVARDANCSVLGIGCTVVDVTQGRDVTIDMSDASNGATACSAGEQCEDAQCAPVHNNGNPATGSGCSMDLLGAGPLADPLAVTGTIVSAPAIAATANGFVVAYREYDPSAGDARLTLIPIDVGGAEGVPQQMMLDGRCAGLIESDATALAYATPTSGLVALARAPCSGTGGIDLYQVDPTGTVGMSNFNGVGSDTVTLSTSHALAASADGSSYLVAYLDAVQTHVAPITGVDVQGLSTAATFGGGAPLSDGWVSTSSGATALVAIGSGDDTDGGSGSSGTTARINLIAAGASVTSLPAPFEYTANWAAVATEGARAFVVNDNNVVGEPVAWNAFDIGATRPTATNGFPLPGTAIYADVAFHGDYVVFAVEQPGQISLVVYAHATTTPTFQSEIDFANDPRIPGTPTLRDGRISIAASDTRMAVTWATGEMLGNSDAVGGYAVFACSP